MVHFDPLKVGIGLAHITARGAYSAILTGRSTFKSHRLVSDAAATSRRGCKGF